MSASTAAPGHRLTSTGTRTEPPPTSDLVEGLLFYPIALVVSATIFPGLTLCIPGLLFVTVLFLVPLVAIALVVVLAGAVLAAPVVLVRAIRGLRERRAKSPRRARLLARAPQPVEIEG